MISISALTYDLSGLLLIKNYERNFESGLRRATRTATLDGESTISDGGYSDSDRTITITILNANQDMLDKVIRFVQLYPLVFLSTKEGCYKAVPNDYLARQSSIIFSLLIKERISA